MSDLMSQVVEHALLRLGFAPETCLSLLSPATSTEQIAVIVDALKHYYPAGLLVLHDPAKGAFLFLPGSSPFFVSFQQAVRWVSAFPQSPCMIFTRGTTSDIGHFQHCSHDSLRACCRNIDTNQSLRHDGLMNSSPMHGAGLFGDGSFNVDAATTPFVEGTSHTPFSALPVPCSDLGCAVCAPVCFGRTPPNFDQPDACEIPVSCHSLSQNCLDLDCRVREQIPTTLSPLEVAQPAHTTNGLPPQTEAPALDDDGDGGRDWWRRSDPTCVCASVGDPTAFQPAAADFGMFESPVSATLPFSVGPSPPAAPMDFDTAVCLGPLVLQPAGARGVPAT